jgi:hypothetical protein
MFMNISVSGTQVSTLLEIYIYNNFKNKFNKAVTYTSSTSIIPQYITELLTLSDNVTDCSNVLKPHNSHSTFRNTYGDNTNEL